MINIASILKHNLVGKLTNHLIVFLINVYIARTLGATGSGPYFNELYLLNFIVFIFSAGLDYAAIALISQENKLLPAILKMLQKVVVAFVGVLLVYVYLILPNTVNYFTQPALSIIFFSVGNLMLIFYQGVLSACKKFNLQNIILCASNLAFLGYLLYQGHNIQLEHLQYAYSVLFILQGSIMWLASMDFKNSGIPSTSTVRWNVFIRKGIYIMISSLIYFLFLRIDNFFVQKYTDDMTLGNYVQCGKIGQYFLYFSSVISSTLLPFIASEKIGNSFTEWKKVVRPYILLLCFAALMVALFGSRLFPIIFGEEFKMMQNLIVILLPGFVCLGILTLMNAVYIGKGNIRKILIGDSLGLIAVAVLDASFVPTYGATAAAIISSSTYCLVFLFLATGFKNQFLVKSKVSEIISI